MHCNTEFTKQVCTSLNSSIYAIHPSSNAINSGIAHILRLVQMPDHSLDAQNCMIVGLELWHEKFKLHYYSCP